MKDIYIVTFIIGYTKYMKDIYIVTFIIGYTKYMKDIYIVTFIIGYTKYMKDIYIVTFIIGYTKYMKDIYIVTFIIGYTKYMKDIYIVTFIIGYTKYMKDIYIVTFIIGYTKYMKDIYIVTFIIGYTKYMKDIFSITWDIQGPTIKSIMIVSYFHYILCRFITIGWLKWNNASSSTYHPTMIPVTQHVFNGFLYDVWSIYIRNFISWFVFIAVYYLRWKFTDIYIVYRHLHSKLTIFGVNTWKDKLISNWIEQYSTPCIYKAIMVNWIEQYSTPCI